MITLTRLETLDSLPLSPSLIAFLKDHLIKFPFGSPDIAQSHWNTMNNQLVIVSEEDKLLSSSDSVLKVPIQQIQLLMDCPEFVLQAPDEYCLALFVIDQEGSGVYLLFPKNTDCPALITLLPKVEGL